MSRISGFIKPLLIVLFSILIAGCASSPDMIIKPLDPHYYPTPTETASITPTPFQAMTYTPMVIPPSNTPTASDTPLPTNTPTATDTPMPSATPEMVWSSGGQVTAPILLYHHVSDDGAGNRYYVSTDKFRAQMEALRDWGYTSITVTDLVDVLINGGELPSRPVVITFDDGNIDVYQNALPIMHEMGYIGTMYIVGNRLQSKYFVNTNEIQEMVGDGWEIGSHGMTHTDLTTDHSVANFEMRQSLLSLEEVTGSPVSSLAYPYGQTDEFVSTKASEFGYTSGMGLGQSYTHYLGTLFYLSRMEIQGGYDMSKFASMLPWSGD